MGLKERILERIAAWGSGEEAFDDAEFEDFASEVAARQRAALPLLEEAGRAVGVQGVGGIPFVPVRLFKETRLACFPPAEEVASFVSSGTTGRRSVRPVRDLDLYEASCRASWRRFVGEAPVFALLPPVGSAPRSSLVRMAHFLGARCFVSGAWEGQAGEAQIDVEAFARAAVEAEGPVVVFGPALAFGRLIEGKARIPTRRLCRPTRRLCRPTRRLCRPLPPRSRVIHTGGTKGVETEWDAAALAEGIREVFGEVEVGVEYGMTEAFSQGYDLDGRGYRFPPWCRVSIVDPNLRAEAAEGETGLVALCDLANLDAPAGLLTEDLGRMENGRLFLEGRATGAEARGCSLVVDRILS